MLEKPSAGVIHMLSISIWHLVVQPVIVNEIVMALNSVHRCYYYILVLQSRVHDATWITTATRTTHSKEETPKTHK